MLRGRSPATATLFFLSSLNMRYLIPSILLSTLVLVIAWQPNAKLLFWQESVSKAKISGTTQAANSTNVELNSDTFATNDSAHEHRDETWENFIPNPKAIESMRQARLKGDPRTPKLTKHHEREVPTEEELGNHEQYLEYEHRQQKRVYRAYVDASKIKTAQLRSMIEQGKAEGISPEEIAFAEDKIKGIEEMAAKLQQDYPDIMEESYQPPSDWLIENLGKDDDSVKSEEPEANIE